MNRRQLFTNVVQASMRGQSPMESVQVVAGSAEQHTDPLTLPDVLHLMRRMGYSSNIADAKRHVGKQALALVTELLGTNEPDVPVNEPQLAKWRDPATNELVDYTENPSGADLNTRLAIEGWWRNNHKALASWSLSSMAVASTSVEKITIFWMGHWTTEFSFDEAYMVPQMLYRQYLLMRKLRLGSLKELALEVTVDNAMLFYLGGTFNEVGKPNENYARELMELFTTGIGWYTEGDVQQAARVLTGWKSNRFNDEPAPKGIYQAWFNAGRHDTGAKEFMGVTIPARTADNNTEFQVKNEEIKELINIIHTVRAGAVSRFIARKVYLNFVFSSPGETDPEFIAELAQAFLESDFNLRELFVKLFTSKHFFDPALRGVQIKTPVEFVVGIQRQLGVAEVDPQAWVNLMDQSMFDPPNVAGWPGYRSWISTNTYPRRREFARKTIDAMTDARANAFIREFSAFNDVSEFVKSVVEFLLPVAVSDERLTFYKSALLEGQPDYTWAEKLQQPSASARALKELLKSIAKAPDFQLC